MHALINSILTPSSDAHVSVAERGFRFGDGVFETIAVHDGRPYQWAFHMQRLQAGLEATHIPAPSETLESDCLRLLKHNQIRDGFLRIYTSRGQGGRGYMPNISATPLTVIETSAHHFSMPDAGALWLSKYEKISPKALPVGCKLSQGMQSTLALLEANTNQCDDALLLDAHGHIAEAASGNIFWLKGGTLHTPALSTGALHGSTRHALMQLSPWPVQEGHYTLVSMEEAEAVILTNCRVKAIPIAALEPNHLTWNSTYFAKQCYELIMHHALS